jgi:hypothetical protein
MADLTRISAAMKTKDDTFSSGSAPASPRLARTST